MSLFMLELRLLAWLAVAWVGATLVLVSARYGLLPALLFAAARAWGRRR